MFWLICNDRYCTACMSYLILCHWSLSWGASALVCSVVMLFALPLAPECLESSTGRMCGGEAKSECITLIKSTVCNRLCCRAVTQGVLSLKWAESQAAVPGVSCMCSVAMDAVRLGGCVCVQRLYLWCWMCICILFKAALCGFVLPAKSRGGGMSTSECSLLSVENKPLLLWEGENVLSLFWAWNCANCKGSQWHQHLWAALPCLTSRVWKWHLEIRLPSSFCSAFFLLVKQRKWFAGK